MKNERRPVSRFEEKPNKDRVITFISFSLNIRLSVKSAGHSRGRIEAEA
jgi:hypothetical protein